MCLMYLCAVFHSCYIILHDAETFSIQGVIVSNAMVTAAFRQNILKCIPKGSYHVDFLWAISWVLGMLQNCNLTTCHEKYHKVHPVHWGQMCKCAGAPSCWKWTSQIPSSLSFSIIHCGNMFWIWGMFYWPVKTVWSNNMTCTKCCPRDEMGSFAFKFLIVRILQCSEVNILFVTQQ